MKTLIYALLLCLFCQSNAFSQNEESTKVDGDFHPWHKDNPDDKSPAVCYTLVSDANLRAKPNASAAVVAKLPIASKVVIEKITTDTATINGFPAPWCEVSFTPKGGARQVGYLWGGTLAFAAWEDKAEYSENFGTMYLVGMAKFDLGKTGTTLQVRVAKNGVELAKSEFKTAGDLGYYLSIESLGNQGLKNLKDAIQIDSYYPACGYGSGKNLVFYSDKKLTRVIETSDFSEAGIFYSSESVILPNDKGGINNHVLVISDSGETEEKEVSKGVIEFVTVKQEYKIVLHKWDGQKLVKVKELK